MGIGNWELGIGNWELGIGNCDQLPGYINSGCIGIINNLAFWLENIDTGGRKHCAPTIMNIGIISRPVDILPVNVTNPQFFLEPQRHKEHKGRKLI
ncbi:MAG: hypothetical protein F6K47_03015 [Symploca sp. SIO2E6]|nr:hypothetical protein [Symploca sp. SIO2E6]